MPITDSRISEIVKVADTPAYDNPPLEEARGMLNELIDELSIRKEQQIMEHGTHVQRLLRQLGVMHKDRSR